MTDVEKIGWYILLSSVVDPKLFFGSGSGLLMKKNYWTLPKLSSRLKEFSTKI
jgi:hypothetical protein